MGTRFTVNAESYYDDNCRREFNTCGCDLLGELHASSEVGCRAYIYNSPTNRSRYSLYSQNVNLYLAPTADARDTWCPLMQTIGFESRAFVLSANQCMTKKNLPPWIRGKAPSALGEKSTDDNQAEINSVEYPKSTEIHFTGNQEVNRQPAAEKSSQPNGSTEEAVTNIPLQTSSTVSPKEEHKSISPASEKSFVAKTSDNHELVLPSTTSPLPKVQPSANTNQENEFVSRGGSCIIGPMGQILAGPLWEVEDGGFLAVEVDFEDCERGRLDLDVAGSYSRNDAFRLTVEGLDINPPP